MANLDRITIAQLKISPEDAIRYLLRALGEDSDRNGLKDTPERVWRAWQEMTAGYKEDPGAILLTVFQETSDEIIILKGIRFSSLCEHHMLPFTGQATVGYIPSGKGVVGLSKLARLVHCYARRLQIQERLTRQIAQAIEVYLEPLGAGVIIKAHHHCMSHRGVNQPEAEMITSAMSGVFRDKPSTRAEFMSLAER